MEKSEGGIVIMRMERRESGRVGHKGMYACRYTLSTHMHTIH